MSPLKNNELLNIHINVEISAHTLQAIVAQAKRLGRQSVNNTYRIDTAEYVSTMISRFLEERDFDAYVCDEKNYPPLPIPKSE